MPRSIDVNHSAAHLTGVAPVDLSASGGWYWGQQRRPLRGGSKNEAFCGVVVVIPIGC